MIENNKQVELVLSSRHPAICYFFSVVHIASRRLLPSRALLSRLGVSGSPPLCLRLPKPLSFGENFEGGDVFLTGFFGRKDLRNKSRTTTEKLVPFPFRTYKHHHVLAEANCSETKAHAKQKAVEMASGKLWSSVSAN